MDLSLIDLRFYYSDSEKAKAYLMIADIFVAEDDMPSILKFCKKNKPE